MLSSLRYQSREYQIHERLTAMRQLCRSGMQQCMVMSSEILHIPTTLTQSTVYRIPVSTKIRRARLVFLGHLTISTLLCNSVRRCILSISPSCYLRRMLNEMLLSSPCSVGNQACCPHIRDPRECESHGSRDVCELAKSEVQWFISYELGACVRKTRRRCTCTRQTHVRCP